MCFTMNWLLKIMYYLLSVCTVNAHRAALPWLSVQVYSTAKAILTGMFISDVMPPMLDVNDCTPDPPTLSVHCGSVNEISTTPVPCTVIAEDGQPVMVGGVASTPVTVETKERNTIINLLST